MKHLHKEGKFLEEGRFLRTFIFGFSDGIVTTLAIVMALSGVAVQNVVIIIAGLANVIADGVSMSLGGYISYKSEVEVYRHAKEKEKIEMKELPEAERREIRKIFFGKGFSGRILEQVVKTLTANKRRWLNVMMEEELGLTERTFENPKKEALITLMAFVLAGSIPLYSYFFFEVQRALQISLAASFTSVFIVGSLRSLFTGKNWMKSGAELLAISMFAGAAAYYIGKFGNRYFAGG